jgi:hypothetical protein
MRTAPDGQRGKALPDGKGFLPATVEDIGLTYKDIHDARQIRGAEEERPGIVRETLDRLIEAGEEPTRAAVKREIASRGNPERPIFLAGIMIRPLKI